MTRLSEESGRPNQGKLSKISQSADVVLPTVDGRELRLRCVVRPDTSQAAIIDRLGLELPRRLNPPRDLEM